MRYDRHEREESVASRRSVPVKGIAGLQRTARLAGECFGHEDIVGGSLTSTAEGASSRWLWWVAAIAASAGLTALHFY